MEIVVLVKQVPDSDNVRMDPESGTMIRSGIENIINPLDMNALELACSLKKSAGARVTALSMGPPQAERALREALALGADRACLLSDTAFAGSDTWTTASALSKALAEIPFDLVLAGEKATDGETGQVGPEAAAILDIPFSTYVSRLELLAEGVKVRRTVEEGFETQILPFPCLVTVLNDINEPRMPTLAGKKRARREVVERKGARDLGLDASETGLGASPTRVVKIDRPRLTRQTEFFARGDLDAGIERVVALLEELAVIGR